jgi:plastocyanin domain-containing protein
MGLISVDNGVALMGGPSLGSLFKPLSQPVQTVDLLPENADGNLTLTAYNNGYFPQVIHAKAGEAQTLDVVTKNTFSCARDFLIPVLRIEKLLPQTGKVSIDLPAQEPGTVMRFTCSMGMYTGKIIFDQ